MLFFYILQKYDLKKRYIFSDIYYDITDLYL
jgi:hypothetical protein